MEITITGKNVEITPVMQEYIQKKFKKLDRFYSKILNCEVIVSQEKHRWIAEVNLEVKGSSLHSHAQTTDFRSAIEEAEDRIIRQIKGFKGKKISSHRQEESRV